MAFRMQVLFAVVGALISAAGFASKALADMGLEVEQTYRCEGASRNETIEIISNSNGLYGIKYFYTPDMTDYERGTINARTGVLRLKSSFSQRWSEAGEIEFKNMNGKDGLLIHFNENFDKKGNSVFCSLL